MKIQQDVTHVINSASFQRKPAEKPINNNASAHNSTTSAPAVFSNSRALNEALSIAQISQSVINRAMTLSMRLKNIASSAMHTGTVDQQELGITMSQLSVLENNATPGVNIDATGLSLDGVSYIPATDVPLSDIANEGKKLEETGQFSFQKMEDAESQLSTTASAARNVESTLTKKHITIGEPLSNSTVDKKVTDVKSKIISNPADALLSQGYIVKENAGKVLG
jgi:hypothetical protein